jgi:hypothetical protein
LGLVGTAAIAVSDRGRIARNISGLPELGDPPRGMAYFSFIAAFGCRHLYRGGINRSVSDSSI